MATKLFITAIEAKEASDILLPPIKSPDGKEVEQNIFKQKDFSLWLENKILNHFKEVKDWEQSEPILLGSWSRGELCPRSDIDILFCGSESKTREIVDSLNLKGIKLRYRMPQDPMDWSKGVEPFDVLALMGAIGLSENSSNKLRLQKDIILKNINRTRKMILKSILSERRERSIRYDSISNYLEPNIKYGSGGLRDLDQGLAVLQLFSEKLDDRGRAELVLKYYKNFFLTVRCKLHLLGATDVLLAHHQEEIAQWMGYKNKTKFMGQIELGLSRVSFYSDWILEKSRVSQKEVNKREKMKISTYNSALAGLKKYPDVLMSYKVRQNLDFIEKSSKPKGTTLNKYFDIKSSEVFFESLFRSRIIDRIIPQMREVFGLVQHDQYHRYSVDAHTLQLAKIVCRTTQKPKMLSGLEDLVKRLKSSDWKILIWSAIYHDIGKGSGRPHEQFGAEVVQKDFALWKLPKSLSAEVAWIVEKHLVISQFAFRQNIRSTQTWSKLSEQGVVGQRLVRLAVFTAMDILATNPEAWNPWKSNLIKELVDIMSGKQTTSFLQMLEKIKVAKIKKPTEEFVSGLEPALVQSIPSQILITDCKKLLKDDTDLELKIVPKNKNSVWIRFHFRQDRPGIFLEIIQRVYSLGYNVQQAFVQTYPTFGAYDWLEIKSNQRAKVIHRNLSIDYEKKPIPHVAFDKVEIVSHEPKETVLSFRGIDQPGVLLRATKAVTESGLVIRWARVLTWGRQIDDVFGVLDPLNRTSDEILNNINKNLR